MSKAAELLQTVWTNDNDFDEPGENFDADDLYRIGSGASKLFIETPRNSNNSSFMSGNMSGPLGDESALTPYREALLEIDDQDAVPVE